MKQNLIDANELMKLIPPEEMVSKLAIANAPTVDAIPKDQYEAHLKADMVTMLEELQLEIGEIVKEEGLIDKKWANGLHYSEKIIQQKINVLKEKENETKTN